MKSKNFYTSSLLADEAGLLDHSFNANGFVGQARAAFNFDIEIRQAVSKLSSTTKDNNDEIKLQQFIKEKTSIIATLGGRFADIVAQTAFKTSKKNVKFVAVDVEYPKTLYKEFNRIGNVNKLRGASFMGNEASFLAGYLAAGMSKTKIVGTFGGENIVPVRSLINGYVGGVNYYNQTHSALTPVKVIGADRFIQSFTNIELARQTTMELVEVDHADIVFPVAGLAGIGAVQYCFQSGKALFIGVDSDWFETALEFQSVILSSVLKRIDSAVYDGIKDDLAKTFKNGQIIYNLANNGVDLAPYHDFETKVPTVLKAEITLVKQGIIKGDIIVP